MRKSKIGVLLTGLLLAFKCINQFKELKSLIFSLEMYKAVSLLFLMSYISQSLIWKFYNSKTLKYFIIMKTS